MTRVGRMRNVRFGFRIGMELPIGTTGVILSRWEHAGGVRLAITLEGVPRFGFASGIRVEEVEVLPAG